MMSLQSYNEVTHEGYPKFYLDRGKKSMERPTGLDFQVVMAAITEIQRHVDIDEIHEIDKPGHVLSISRLPSNRVLVIVYKKMTCQKKIVPLFAQRVVVTRGMTIPTGTPTDDLQDETSTSH
jgi:hypothetical protein